MIGIGICPAIGVARGHPEQVAHGDLLAARGRGVGQLGQVCQHRVIQAERTLALEQADGQ
jgi:hypothetical protein